MFLAFCWNCHEQKTLNLYDSKDITHKIFLCEGMLQRKNVGVIGTSTYLLDLSPTDFFLVTQLKLTLEGN